MGLLIQKILSAIISLAMLLGTGSTAGVQVNDDKRTAVDGSDVITVENYEDAEKALSGDYTAASELEKDEVYPTIIIHGIGQADTWAVDDNGDPIYDKQGNLVTGWPLYFNVPELVLKLGYPLLRTLITQEDNGLCDILYDSVYDAMSLNAYNDDGTPKNNLEVDQYDNRPVSQCTQEEKDHIYGCVPLQDYADAVGEENLYYFAYNSFGDTYSIVDDLEETIEQAKKDTGKDKVNIVPISLGGAIAAAYVDENKTGENINKIVFIVPALDGSEIVGKLMAGELDLSDEGIYRNMFTKLVGVDVYTGWMINIALRILPKQEVKDMLLTVAKAISDSALSHSMNMWGLVPNSMYDELSDEYLTDGTALKAEADKFHEAQSNLVENLKNYEDNGIGIYDVCAYGMELYSLIDSGSNSDKIIYSASTSMGATFSAVDSTLGDNYVQKNYTDYNMLSPDGMVDASTSAFPFTTWFFGNQDHEKIARNDVVVRLASTILISKDMNIYSTQDYPQFNGRRNSRDLKDMVTEAKALDLTQYDEATATRLHNAITAAELNLAKTVIIEGETEAAQSELRAALVQAGVYEKENTTKDTVLLRLFRGLSEFLYQYYGPRGFTDPVSAIG